MIDKDGLYIEVFHDGLGWVAPPRALQETVESARADIEDRKKRNPRPWRIVRVTTSKEVVIDWLELEDRP